jgi:hypothetical protein
MDARDGLNPKGRVEVLVTRGKPQVKKGQRIQVAKGVWIDEFYEVELKTDQLIDYIDIKNLIVNSGKSKVITSLVAGSTNPIGRMCIGDRGTIPSDPTVPKVPAETTTAITGLYNEVYRGDIDGITLNVGTLGINEARFTKTFSALDIPIASFSNQSKPVVNEVGLITYDPGYGPIPSRAPVWAPNAPMADETLFSIRTFKSVPFEAANEISVTIRYTIFIE